MQKTKLRNFPIIMFVFMLAAACLFLFVGCGAEEDDKYKSNKIRYITASTTKIEGDYKYTLKENIILDHFIDAKNFEGTIDGNGYSIRLSGAKAIFTEINKNVHIKDLKIFNGGVAKIVNKNAKITVDNIRIENTSYAMFEKTEGETLITNSKVLGLIDESLSNYQNYVGAFVSHATGKLTIDNSVNSATVSGTKAVGGFVGYVSGNNSDVLINSCINNGDIIGNVSAGGFVGETQIMLENYYTISGGKITINNSENKGNVVATNPNGKSFASGFVGRSEDDGGIYMNGCKNFGNLSGDYAAGAACWVDNYISCGLSNWVNAGSVVGTIKSSTGLCKWKTYWFGPF